MAVESNGKRSRSRSRTRWTRSRPGVIIQNGEPPPTSFDPPSWAPGCAPREIFGPVHDFLRGRRKPSWRANCPESLPMLFVDRATILREVCDLRRLRRGDHCLIAVNAARTLHPWLDYFTSLLTALELWRVCHHFLILDDVDHVDANGIPRTRDGQLVSALEATNTPFEMIEEIRMMSGGSYLYFLPNFIWCMIYHKAEPHRTALADYGDMPFIFRVEEQLSDSNRQRIVRDAEQLLVDARQPGKVPIYGFLNANCEHFVNRVASAKRHTSPSLHFVITWLVLLLIRVAIVWSLCRLHDDCINGGCAETSERWGNWTLLVALAPTCVCLVAELRRATVASARACSSNLISNSEWLYLTIKEIVRVSACALSFFVCLQQAKYEALHAELTSFSCYAVVFSLMVADMAVSATLQIFLRGFVYFCFSGRRSGVKVD